MAIKDLTQEEQDLLSICDEYVETKIKLESITSRSGMVREVWEWATKGMSKKRVAKILKKARKEMERHVR